jgi:hypothetical protein
VVESSLGFEKLATKSTKIAKEEVYALFMFLVLSVANSPGSEDGALRSGKTGTVIDYCVSLLADAILGLVTKLHLVTQLSWQLGCLIVL